MDFVQETYDLPEIKKVPPFGGTFNLWCTVGYRLITLSVITLLS